jgi:hypothetical protein
MSGKMSALTVTYLHIGHGCQISDSMNKLQVVLPWSAPGNFEKMGIQEPIHNQPKLTLLYNPPVFGILYIHEYLHNFFSNFIGLVMPLF